MTTTDPKISHGEIAGLTETSEDNLVPPGGSAYYPGEDNLGAPAEIQRLTDFLSARFPDEVGRTNVQVAESPVDVAIRLLSALSASGTTQARCDEQYCNKASGHSDVHGWVHFG